MTCAECAKAAKANRELEDTNARAPRVRHPENCGCTCMHRSGPWEKLFSVSRPNA